VTNLLGQAAEKSPFDARKQQDRLHPTVFCKASRPALRSTRLPVQRAPRGGGGLFPGSKAVRA
jgi:hypothetical protein